MTDTKMTRVAILLQRELPPSRSAELSCMQLTILTAHSVQWYLCLGDKGLVTGDAEELTLNQS